MSLLQSLVSGKQGKSQFKGTLQDSTKMFALNGNSKWYRRSASVFSPSTITPNNPTECKLEFSNNVETRIQDMFFEYVLTNTHATDSAVFRGGNHLFLIDSLGVRINGTDILANNRMTGESIHQMISLVRKQVSLL